MISRVIRRGVKYNSATGKTEGISVEEYAEVSKWKSQFTIDKIPTDYFTATFSRSSGSGGQNVNKGEKHFLVFINNSEYENRLENSYLETSLDAHFRKIKTHFR